MLWYKAWLETRWRFAFLVGSILVVWLAPLWISSTGVPPGVPAAKQWMGLQLGSVLLYIFTAIYLAGSGINSQTLYAATSGFHGSMLFTLSLPVSRRRLLFVRAGLGALLTCILVAIMAGYILLRRPEATSALQSLVYLTRAIVCTMPVYALSVLVACVLDEMWQFMSACFVWVAVFLLQARVEVVSRVSPLRGMSLNCYPITAPMPWAPVAVSLVLTGVLLSLSVLVLQRKDY
jgi:F0F1-type ATP synthase membrane subunit c/vacuolar-type H+-ATPase subunit K